MKRVLVIGPKNVSAERLQEVLDLVRAQTSGKCEVIALSGTQWEEIRRREGSWKAMYAWAAHSHDALIAVPVECDKKNAWFSRGCAEMIAMAIALCKPVLVCTGTCLQGVRALEPGGRNDWAGSWGRAELQPIV